MACRASDASASSPPEEVVRLASAWTEVEGGNAVSKVQFGQLPPRYSFLLNPHLGVRLSRCPECDRLTHYRKFVLCIHIDGFGLMGLGKTCRYCTPCELVIAHKDELETELWHGLENIAPAAVGNDYLVLGTSDKKVWQKGLGKGVDDKIEEFLAHTAQFKKHLILELTGGYGFSGDPKPLPGPASRLPR